MLVSFGSGLAEMFAVNATAAVGTNARLANRKRNGTRPRALRAANSFNFAAPDSCPASSLMPIPRIRIFVNAKMAGSR